MKPVVKGFVIGCSILLIIGVAAVVAIIWFMRSKSEDWVAKGNEVRAAAAQFGKNVPEPRCVEEAMSRYRLKTGIVGGIEQRVWLGGCLEASAFDSGFCEGVPPDSEIVRSATWRAARCANLGFSGDSTCPNILAEVQTYCQGPARRKKQ